MTAEAQTAPQKTGAATAERARADYVDLPIAEIEKNAGKNIRELDPASVKELAESIRRHGVLEPVIVRRNDVGLELIAGFRRVAAAKLAGLKNVPARILLVDANVGLEVQMVENLQREDLRPLEEARAMKAYLEATNATQEQLGKKIGKSQPYVANRLRLLALPEKGAKLLEEGKLSPAAAEQIMKLPAEAKPEINRAIREIERKAEYRGGVTVDEAKWATESALRIYRTRQAKEKKVAAAKFPACPVKGCGKAGRPPQEWSSSKDFECSNGHHWNPTTGAVSPGERHVHTDRGERQPPAPTVPAVTPQVMLKIPQAQVMKRVLDSIKEIRVLQLVWHSGTRARLDLEVEAPSLKGARVPEFAASSGHKFLELTIAAESWMQRDDAGRKQAAKQKADLEAWLESMGRAKKGK
jgi:ParB/RepB/Spo0J family partition protein